MSNLDIGLVIAGGAVCLWLLACQRLSKPAFAGAALALVVAFYEPAFLAISKGCGSVVLMFCVMFSISRIWDRGDDYRDGSLARERERNARLQRALDDLHERKEPPHEDDSVSKLR